MKTPDLQSRKLKLIEMFMRINDVQVLDKLQAVLAKETAKKQKSTVITDELLEELDRRWDDYKKGKSKLYTFEQVRAAANRKLKASRNK